MQFLQHPWQAMYPAQQAAAAAAQYPAYFGQMAATTGASAPAPAVAHAPPPTVAHPVIASAPSVAPSPALLRAAPKAVGAPQAAAPQAPAQEPVPALKAECDSSVPSPPASRKSELEVESQGKAGYRRVWEGVTCLFIH